MSNDIGDLPDPQVDREPERAPGGADADENAESDVGAASDGTPLTPDQPLSAQTAEDAIPDEIQEPERPEPDEQATDNTDEPSA